MAHVLIRYSIPAYSGDLLLDGSADTTIRGYQNFAVSIRTNHPATLASSGIYAPPGYYITSQPQVSFDPPKVNLCSVVTTSTCFSREPLNTVLDRMSGSTAGVS